MRNLFLCYVVIIFSTTCCFLACKSPKSQSVTKGDVELNMPFSEDKYKTDKDYFRATGQGKSPDLATAKSIALLNAETQIARNINTKIKAVIDQYTNQRSIADKQDYESKFEQETRSIVNQSISDVKILGEKAFKENNGTINYFIVIEISKTSLKENISNKISSNQKLQLDYDKKKFEETFNAEMEKLDKERNN